MGFRSEVFMKETGTTERGTAERLDARDLAELRAATDAHARAAEEAQRAAAEARDSAAILGYLRRRIMGDYAIADADRVADDGAITRATICRAE
jgi:hypothetical protein